MGLCIEKAYPPHSILMTSQSDGTLYGKGLPLEFDRNLGWKRPTPKQSEVMIRSDDVIRMECCWK